MYAGIQVTLGITWVLHTSHLCTTSGYMQKYKINVQGIIQERQNLPYPDISLTGTSLYQVGTSVLGYMHNATHMCITIDYISVKEAHIITIRDLK